MFTMLTILMAATFFLVGGATGLWLGWARGYQDGKVTEASQEATRALIRAVDQDRKVRNLVERP